MLEAEGAGLGHDLWRRRVGRQGSVVRGGRGRREKGVRRRSVDPGLGGPRRQPEEGEGGSPLPGAPRNPPGLLGLRDDGEPEPVLLPLGRDAQELRDAWRPVLPTLRRP